jgi:hypothetical protein
MINGSLEQYYITKDEHHFIFADRVGQYILLYAGSPILMVISNKFSVQ